MPPASAATARAPRSRGPCGRRWQPRRAARRAPASDMAATQSGGPPRLHVPGPDHHVVEIVASAMETEPLAANGGVAPRCLRPSARCGARRQTEAAQSCGVQPMPMLTSMRRSPHPSRSRSSAEWYRTVSERYRGNVVDVADFGTARRCRLADRTPRGQVAVIEEVMFGGRHEIESEPSSMNHLIHDRGDRLSACSMPIRASAGIVDRADARGRTHDVVLRGQDLISAAW